MDTVSIIIPARNERFLPQTVSDVLSKTSETTEIIVVLDGYWPTPPLPNNNRIKVIHFGSPRGMRACINAGVSSSRAEYIIKLDAHCMVDNDFDQKLIAECKMDYVVVPRRYRLDAEKWQIRADSPNPVDYHTFSRPDEPSEYGGPGLHGKNWHTKSNKLKNDQTTSIDDLMTFQGSCWCMSRRYFFYLDLMDENHYGTFAAEAQEIGFKCWLSGGRVIINKKTWYAHLHKGAAYGQGYKLEPGMRIKAIEYTNKWMENAAWHKQTLPFSWFVKKFWPIPGWEGLYERFVTNQNT